MWLIIFDRTKTDTNNYFYQFYYFFHEELWLVTNGKYYKIT